MGGPVVHCTPGVRLRDRSQQFTLPCLTIFSERHFRTPSVRICTVPQNLSRTAHLDCEYTNSTKLARPIVPRTGGVLVQYHLQDFPSPWQTVCSERNFHTPSVRICTIP